MVETMIQATYLLICGGRDYLGTSLTMTVLCKHVRNKTCAEPADPFSQKLCSFLIVCIRAYAKLELVWFSPYQSVEGPSS